MTDWKTRLKQIAEKSSEGILQGKMNSRDRKKIHDQYIRILKKLSPKTRNKAIKYYQEQVRKNLGVQS